jgi:Replication initiation factor
MFQQAKLVDAGIDYIRVTSEVFTRQQQMFLFYHTIAMRDMVLGYEQKPGGAFGFVGKKTRHALWGVKKTWAMVQASGSAAKTALRIALPGTQSSRLDVQATFRIDQGTVGMAIRNAYEAACAHVRPKARPLKVVLIEERHAAQTCYIGSRASDIFIRIYDKYEESGKEEFKDCIRFEVELKGRASKAVWKKLVYDGWGVGDLLSLLFELLQERGVDVPCKDFDAHDIIVLKREKTTLESTLAWLSTQVSPTVRKLAGEVGWFSLFSILFHDALAEWDRLRIVRSLAFIWGS